MSADGAGDVMSGKSRERLRPLEARDLEVIRTWRNHPDIRRYMYTQHTIGREEHQRWFEHADADPDKYLLIFERDGVPTGFVNLSIVDQAARRAEWGFYLAPEAPKGSGTLLGKRALSYAFKDLNQNKLCGEALAANHRSIRFHERLGFRQEGRLRDHHFDGSEYHDVIAFGLMAREWHEETGPGTR